MPERASSGHRRRTCFGICGQVFAIETSILGCPRCRQVLFSSTRRTSPTMLRSWLVGTTAVVTRFLNFAERTGKCQIPYFDIASEFQRNLVLGV
jgi:hypothetical protein